jgi:glycosyltransferase EpsD
MKAQDKQLQRILIVANVAQEHIRKFHIPIIQYFQSRGCQVDVACRMDVPVPEADQTFDLPCDRNPFKGGLLESAKILSEIIISNKYDAVICNTLSGGIIARLAMRKVRRKAKAGLIAKLFYIVHGLHFFEGAPLSRWVLGYPLEKLLAPMTDVIITINAADEKMVKKCLRPGAVERIPGIGCKFDRFRSCVVTSEGRSDIRSSFGIGEDDLTLIYVAEINDNKNQGMLLDVMDKIRDQRPGVKLLLVGPEHDDGQLSERAGQEAQTAGRKEDIIFAGWRNDVPRLLKCADIYVASSKSEGLPINLLEAMSCGLPVIAGKNRGHSEILDHGSNGFLVERGDAAAMAEYVLKVTEDPTLKQTLTSQAQEDIQRYASENVHKALEGILEKYTF